MYICIYLPVYHIEQLSILSVTALSTGKPSTYPRVWELRDYPGDLWIGCWLIVDSTRSLPPPVFLRWAP